MEGALLRIEGLGKTYGKYAALKDVSFSLHQGDVLGIIGENGAGKSTLLSLVGMIQKPTAGCVYFDEKPVAKYKREYLSNIGYVPQEIALFEELSGKENLLFFGKSYGLSKKQCEGEIQRVLEITEFPDGWLNEPVSKYSVGMKRKINIGAALLHEPRVLLLDEPVANLDFETEEQVIRALQVLAEQGTTILYVGHQMEQMELLCNKLCLLKEGRQILFGETEKLLCAGQKTLKQLWRENVRTVPEKE